MSESVWSKVVRDMSASFAKSGPWAILALGLLLAIGFGVYKTALKADSLVTAYLSKQGDAMVALGESSQQTAEAMETLILFSKDVSTVHANQQNTLDALTDLAGSAEHRDAAILLQLEQLVKQMETANEMMAQVPSQREDELREQQAQRALLERIDSGIRDLRQVLTNPSGTPNGG